MQRKAPWCSPAQPQLRRVFASFMNSEGKLDKFGLKCAAMALLGRKINKVRLQMFEFG
jgi:hypothetical protein